MPPIVRGFYVLQFGLKPLKSSSITLKRLYLTNNGKGKQLTLVDENTINQEVN